MQRLFLSLSLVVSLALSLSFTALGCSSSDGDGAPDAALEDSTFQGSALKVAAVQYGSADYHGVQGCEDDLCGLGHYVREAAANGAKIVVTPEYALGVRLPENEPAVGDLPRDDVRWSDFTMLKPLSALANELNITLIATVATKKGTTIHNTQIALDAAGRVVAVHHKFHLFGTNETSYLTAGTSVATSTFDTPLGKAGMLICADIQCVVAGVGPDCAASELKLLADFAALGAKVVFFSAKWTVGQANGAASIWWPINVQKKYAEQAKTHVVAANTTLAPGQGAGIFAPGGSTISSTEATQPSVIYAELPVP